MSASARAPAASSMRAPPAAAPAAAVDLDELPDECSEPFFKGIGVVYVEVEADGSDHCDLCDYARRNPAPPSEDPAWDESLSRWGVLHDCMDDVTLCREDEENQHAFHAKCLRAFVMGHKTHFRNKPGCPVCDKLINDATADAAAAAAAAAAAKPAAGVKPAGAAAEEKKHDGGDDDDDLFGEDGGQPDEVGQTGGKKRNRAKQMYSIWVHVRQATGLKLVKSDKTMNPVAFVSAFGKTVNTAKGDGGKTYNCVWNEAFSFQKMMDEDEFSREVIQIRVEDSTAVFRNTLIGFVKFQAETVHVQPNHEFYQLNYPLVNMASKKQDRSVTMQGQLEVSVCVLTEQDVKDDPTLPRHIYDAEVEMWAELQNKAEVVDFDLDKSYLQNNLDLKKEQDLALKATEFDIVHVRVYRAEDLPKLDSRGWVDAFIELEYKGLMDKGAKLKSKPVLKSANPAWNVEFTMPIVHGAPLIYDAFELVVKNHNALVSDDWIGKCAVNISDILKMPEQSPPMWKSLYQDIDGKAPTYRGRVLIEVSVEKQQKDAKLFCKPCEPCRDALVPPSGSYRLDFELLEGIHLLENYSDYQVDITMGHSMTVGGGSDDPKERDKGGKAWATIESDMKNVKGANKTIVPFLTKKSLTVHNLPYPRQADQAVMEQERLAAEEAAAKTKADAAQGSDAAGGAAGSTGTVTPHLSAAGTPLGFKGDASALAFSSVLENFNKCTTLLDYKSMMPDVIIYVSKKGGESGRKQCVGYLRIPMNGLKRPTENWEHGEDLTVAPHLWEASKASARSYALKPLVELYQLTSGFLLFKLTITPVEGKAASALANQSATSKLAPVPRQRYRFVANVFQAKDMASVDASGLSSPFATVQIGDVVAKSKHQPLTCNPLWFEALTAEVELPCNLLYAPDFAVTCYHYKSSLFKFNDPSIFMGRADVAASTASTSGEMSEPAWYPLQFEEMQYGNILLSFRLTPISASSAASPQLQVEQVQSGLERLISGWENYAVEISALDIRGKMASKHRSKKIDPTYQLECWGDVQSYRASSIAKDKFTVYLRKPSNPVFYSAVNFRVYEGKDLTGVTSVPLSKILRSGVGWYKLMELLLREEGMTHRRVVRKWRAFIRKKKFVDPRTIRRVPKPAIMPAGADGTLLEGDAAAAPAAEGKEGEEGDEFAASASRWAPRTDATASSSSGPVEPPTPTVGGRKVNERTALKLASGDQPAYSTDAGDSGADSALSSGEGATAGEALSSDAVALDVSPDAELLANALKPREVDAEGNEVIDEKDLKPLRYLQAEQMPDKDAGNPFETHWRLECEYEMLPLVNDPFLDSELFVGKDEIHSTFLDKLFSRGKQSVGRLRGHFYGYRIGALPRPGAPRDSSLDIPRVNPLFDAEKYFHGMEYCIRVYVLRGLQLRSKKGKAASCDPFVSLSIAGGEVQKSEVLDGTLNPQWYKCFDFMRVGLPAIDSALTVSVYNDNTILSADLIGSTEIQLENRLCSKPWNLGQKPIERRALKKTKSGRLPQGFIELCVQIIPMHEAGTRSLDYLLSPPKRLPWELRVILWNCRKVTMKKIYKTEDNGFGCCNCCYDLCAPPNQSDIKLIAGLSGSKQAPQATDTHLRSTDGDGMFNYRCVFDLELPSPKMLCNLKVQVWNINWNPDDCLAEAIIPLWGFFEVARRELEKAPGDADKQIRRIPRQWVHMTHPQNSDQGEVEIEIELLPSELAQSVEYKAAKGFDGFKPLLNGPARVLPPPNRPDDSFPWYRLDLQLLWRCKYCWRKARWYVLGMIIMALAGIAALAYLKSRQWI